MSTIKVFPQSKQFRHHCQFTRNNGTVITLQNSNANLAWEDTVSYGDDWPDWRQRLVEGRDATTGLLVVGKKVAYKPGKLRVSLKAESVSPNALKTGTYVRSGDFGLSKTFSGDPTNISDKKANAEALGKFVTRATQINTKFQGGVFAGELAQTIHGIKHPAQGLRNLVDAYRRRAVRLRSSQRNKGNLAKLVARALSDLWLEQAFHWRPLFHDIQDGVTAAAELLKKHEERPESAPVRASAQAESNAVYSHTGIQTDGIGVWDTHQTTRDNIIVVFRGAIRVLPLQSMSGTAKLLGFDAASFAPTVWELLPYSFLIDYFTNVGEIVYGLSLPRSLVSWSNSTTIKETVVERWVTCNSALFSGFSTRLDSFSAPRVVLKRREVVRSSYNGSFIPPLDLQMPGSGSLKWLNIAALGFSAASDRRFRWL